MKFLLARKQEIQFKEIVASGGIFGSADITYLENDAASPECDEERKLFTAVGRMIEGYKQPTDMCRHDTKLTIYIKDFNVPLRQATLQITQKSPMLKDIATCFGKDNIFVIVILTNFQRHNPITTHKEKAIKGIGIYSKGMEVSPELNRMCQDSSFQFPNEEIFGVFNGSACPGAGAVTARITVEVELNVGGGPSFPMTPAKDSSKTAIYEKMLHDEVHSDVMIIAKNGNPVKCHVSVLCASSPVFEAMFQTSMKESSTHQIEMSDMTEEGVRAFLKWIYYQSEEDPGEDSRIAFELLTAAHKYDVTPDLESAMTNLFLSKREEWYELDVAVELFQFARNVACREELKVVAVQVFRRNLSALREMPIYKKMFKKDPDAAMELCELALASTL